MERLDREMLAGMRAESEVFLPPEDIGPLLDDAQALLLERVAAGGCSLPDEPYALLLAIVIYAAWITLHSRALDCSQGALIAACHRAVTCLDWTVRPELPCNRRAMAEAVEELLVDLAEELMR